MGVVAENRLYCRFARATKREFDRAYADGGTVAIAKDPEWAHNHETFLAVGFTREQVPDAYADGPSRPGEHWFFWVAVPGTETPTGPAEFHWRRGKSHFTFHCRCGIAAELFASFEEATTARDLHAATHA